MRRRGFSILELALVGSLLSVVMLLLLQALTPCLRIWVLTEQASEVRTRGVLVHQRVLAEMRGTCASSVRAAGSAVSFLAVGKEGGYNPVNGKPIYREMVAYWLEEGVLYRRASTVAGLPTATPFALTDAELAGFCRSGKVICREVSGFGFASGVLSLETSSRKARSRREAHVHFRNGT
ncbi:MAG: hypothetical protein KF760_29570 [Candidatus Eremiobacteraeota bacterium]|nr:hypothetical protein [Candidatus Eremiobacteraeota bacterium]